MEDTKKSILENEFHKLIESENKLPPEKRLIRVFLFV